MNAINVTAAKPRLLLTINGGSSSIKFALFEPGAPPRRVLAGQIERLGLPDAQFGLGDADGWAIDAPNHTAAGNTLLDWLEEHVGRDTLSAVGHRVVHGGTEVQRAAADHAPDGRVPPWTESV